MDSGARSGLVCCPATGEPGRFGRPSGSATGRLRVGSGSRSGPRSHGRPIRTRPRPSVTTGLGSNLSPGTRRTAVLVQERFERGGSCFGGSSRSRLPFGPGLRRLGPELGGPARGFLLGPGERASARRRVEEAPLLALHAEVASAAEMRFRNPRASRAPDSASKYFRASARTTSNSVGQIDRSRVSFGSVAAAGAAAVRMKRMTPARSFPLMIGELVKTVNPDRHLPSLPYRRNRWRYEPDFGKGYVVDARLSTRILPSRRTEEAIRQRSNRVAHIRNGTSGSA